MSLSKLWRWLREQAAEETTSQGCLALGRASPQAGHRATLEERVMLDSTQPLSDPT